MASRFLTILTGHNLPEIWQSREAEPSIINARTVADFTRVVEQTGTLVKREDPAPAGGRRPMPERDANSSRGRLVIPTLILIGALDDWTPAADCSEKASAARSVPRSTLQ
jgi:hypothetical protein